MTLTSAIFQLRNTALRPGRVVAVSLFVLSAASADRADASCGDWLAVHDEAVDNSTETDAPAAPCDGPSCRRSRQDLPIVPPAPTRQLDRSERWLQIVEELTTRPPLTSLLPREARLELIEGERASIDRPPRA